MPRVTFGDLRQINPQLGRTGLEGVGESFRAGYRLTQRDREIEQQQQALEIRMKEAELRQKVFDAEAAERAAKAEDDAFRDEARRRATLHEIKNRNRGMGDREGRMRILEGVLQDPRLKDADRRFIMERVRATEHQRALNEGYAKEMEAINLAEQNKHITPEVAKELKEISQTNQQMGRMPGEAADRAQRAKDFAKKHRKSNRYWESMLKHFDEVVTDKFDVKTPGGRKMYDAYLEIRGDYDDEYGRETVDPEEFVQRVEGLMQPGIMAPAPPVNGQATGGGQAQAQQPQMSPADRAELVESSQRKLKTPAGRKELSAELQEVLANGNALEMIEYAEAAGLSVNDPQVYSMLTGILRGKYPGKRKERSKQRERGEAAMRGKLKEGNLLEKGLGHLGDITDPR